MSKIKAEFYFPYLCIDIGNLFLFGKWVVASRKVLGLNICPEVGKDDGNGGEAM